MIVSERDCCSMLSLNSELPYGATKTTFLKISETSQQRKGPQCADDVRQGVKDHESCMACSSMLERVSEGEWLPRSRRCKHRTDCCNRGPSLAPIMNKRGVRRFFHNAMPAVR